MVLHTCHIHCPTLYAAIAVRCRIKLNFNYCREYINGIEDGGECKCHLCERAFCNGLGLFQHLRRSGNFYDKTYKCEKCSKTFSERYQLWKHERRSHSEKAPATEIDVQIVEKKLRSPEFKFVCEICYKLFKTVSTLRKHRKKHFLTPGSHVCQICGKGFNSAESLSGHLERVHPTERPYACDKCKKAFSRPRYLRKHQSRVHNKALPV